MNPLLLTILLVLPSYGILDDHHSNDTTWCHADHQEHDEEHELPESLDFLRDLFQRYGHDGHNETCTIGKHGMEHLLKDIGIANATSHGHDDEHDAHDDDDHDAHEDDHDHMRKRRSSGEAGRRLAIVRRSVDDHHDNHSHSEGVSHTCYDQHQLMEIHALNDSVGVDRAGLTSLCPALIQQLSSRACWEKASHTQNNQEITDAQKYGFGTLAVLIISGLALPGILVVRWRHSAAYKYIISTMLGLAVGSLFGDATLHLIPQALGLHDHEDDGHNHGHGHGTGGVTVEPFVWKMLALNAGTYAFFLLQVVLAIWVYKKQQNSVDSESTTAVNGGMNGSYKASHEHIVMEKGKDNSAFEMENGNAVQQTPNGHAGSPPEKVSPALPRTTELGGSREKLETVDDSLGWMVCIGDAIHNFADGLAIGASFAAGWKSGLSTSIAVACHELPHELGDVAAMLSIGWSARKVVLLNLLAAMTAFAGLYIGIPVSENADARQWIFVVTAGMFLYIALADILPEIRELMEKHEPIRISVAAGCGMLLGLAAMLLIAIFEHHIRIG